MHVLRVARENERGGFLMYRHRTGIEKAVDTREIQDAWSKICDKAQILYNKNRVNVSTFDMNENRIGIVEQIIGEWIEAGEPS